MTHSERSEVDSLNLFVARYYTKMNCVYYSVLTDPGDVGGPVRQAERSLLLLLLESSRLFFVIFLGVLGSLVERRDVANGVAHLVHARPLTVVPHGRTPGTSGFSSFSTRERLPGRYAQLFRTFIQSPFHMEDLHVQYLRRTSRLRFTLFHMEDPTEFPRFSTIHLCKRLPGNEVQVISNTYSTWQIGKQARGCRKTFTSVEGLTIFYFVPHGRASGTE